MPCLFTGLDCSVWVVVLWIVCSTLSVYFSLKSSDFFLFVFEFIAESLKSGIIIRYMSDCRGADVKPHDVIRSFKLLVWFAFKDKLDKETSFSIFVLI